MDTTKKAARAMWQSANGALTQPRAPKMALLSMVIASFMLLLSSSAVAIGEVSDQTVFYGEMVQQYAVVKIIDEGGASYDLMCSDCWCDFSAYQLDGVQAVAGKNMTSMSSGLFGYQANPADFKAGVYYRAVVNCTSPTYGSGTVDSRFRVLTDMSATPTIGVQDDGGGILDFTPLINWFTDHLDILVWLNTNILDPIVSPFKNFMALSGLGGLFAFIQTFLFSVIDFVVSLLGILFSLIGAFIAFVKDPVGYTVKVAIPWALGKAWYVVMFAAPWFALLEVIIIAWSVMTSQRPSRSGGSELDLMAMLMKWGMAHIKVIGLMAVWVWYTAQGLGLMAHAISNLFTSLKKLVPSPGGVAGS